MVDLATGTPRTTGQVLVTMTAADGTELSFDAGTSNDGSFSVPTPGLARLPGPVDTDLMYADRDHAVCEVRLLVP